MPTVEVGLLGPLEVGVSGHRVELRRPKQRALLALLALRAGEVVSIDRLVDELWGDPPPKTAVGSLQNLVSELRKLLGPDVLITRAPGYVLAIDRALVDAHRFERSVAEAGGAPADKRAAMLREALALWRGPALADLVFEPFAPAEIARLEALRAAAKEDFFDAELELGGHRSLVAELEAYVDEHPLRERPRGQLMLALYRSGRQADALEAYRAGRETLVEELGIDPSPELQRLEQAILRQDRALDLELEPEARMPTPDRRKTVTVLFADIVNSTELGVTLDPEVFRSVLSRHFEAIRSIVERHGGIVEKFIGDAVMAAFGIPIVHEDDAARAVRAASDMRTALSELGRQLTEERGVALEFRIGITTGEVVVGDSSSGESFATGPAVNAAMRLQQAAPPGEILLGEATLRLVGHAVETAPVEPLDLGPLGRIRAFRLLEVGRAGRPLGGAVLVGRAAELAQLRRTFDQVRDERRSSVVNVLGDAGVGKTRLAAELLALIGDEATTLTGRCVSYGEGATYLPLAEIVRQAFPRRTQRKVSLLLADDEHGERVAAQIAQLTGEAEPTGTPGEVFWAVRRLLEGLAADKPLVVVLEDLHWAEPTLLDLVEYLGAWVSEAPVLVLCLARADVTRERPGWATGSTAITLEPLSPDESSELVHAIAAELPEESKRRVVEVAEGNALFVEQLVAYLADAGPDALKSVPPTVDALLASRLDALESDERGLVERAAVAGKDFRRGEVLHLSPPDEVALVDVTLRTLEGKGLVVRTEEADRYRFHHALIRDVAYSGITKALRADLHERFGAWLEQHAGADELVGYHLEQAHGYRTELHPSAPGLSALALRAGSRLADAGIRAFKRADISATTNLLGRAAPLLTDDESRQAEVLCELGLAQRWSGELKASRASLTAAVEAAGGAPDRSRGLRARMELAQLRLLTDRDSNSDEFVDVAQEAIPLFEQLGDARALGRAWRLVGYVRGAMQGRCDEWRAASERALEHYRRSGWSTSGCVSELAAALHYGPTPVRAALARCSELLDETAERSGRAYVLVYVAGLEAMSERFDEANGRLAEAEESFRELGESYALVNNASRIRGRIELLSGSPAAAERTFRECCAEFEQANDEAALATVAADLAHALCEQGQFPAAREWASLAEEHAPAGDLAAQFSWRSVLGRIVAATGDVDRGLALTSDALRLVERTDALTHHGDVLLDLAHVHRLSNRAADAIEQVDRALELFEAKENTASARVARSFLAELAVV
jgi:DNA-binding SARP family transcriptional activator